ncbi:NAD(P)H-binding protein [Ornithinimicrobium sp. INDO-MA30-4]|uniref:NAD(P)H-binding protein n=1 Tax=Ornithinimicrobium sp. INDO-MA30-4 TaxID=2908651 RepID=UPI001F3A6765|nr:NAD(P)H-binding protein [Ornithinimicrobium sp. INDO-MA30-4]UJH70247.1 NAD(P)H-binding protein [Ornithinimicrobium sp. INDO-MA30-4]
MPAKRALVTGATGYIGSRLVPALLREGWTVRVLTRNADKIKPREWADQVEVAEGSATDAQELADALAGVDTAYYLIHSMDGGGDFVSRDRALAQGFAKTAEKRESSASSTSVASTRRAKNYPRTWAHARKSKTFCSAQVCPQLCYVPL